MISIVGAYKNEHLKLGRDYLAKKPVKVIVTFLEDVQVSSDTGLTLDDFSFSKSRRNIENIRGSFADTVITERRANL